MLTNHKHSETMMWWCDQLEIELCILFQGKEESILMDDKNGLLHVVRSVFFFFFFWGGGGGVVAGGDPYKPRLLMICDFKTYNNIIICSSTARCAYLERMRSVLNIHGKTFATYSPSIKTMDVFYNWIHCELMIETKRHTSLVRPYVEIDRKWTFIDLIVLVSISVIYLTNSHCVKNYQVSRRTCFVQPLLYT